MATDAERLPDELKALRRWVNAHTDSKVPMQSALSQAASPSDPETWADFEDSKASMDSGFYSFMGFVFADDGYIGIDIDTGYEDSLLSPLAIDVISHCQSYTEKSKSGRGFHIILKGDIPFSGQNNRKGMEIYKTGRYFVLTGDTFVYDKLCENQQAIDYIIQKYFADAPVAESGNRQSLNTVYKLVWPEKSGHIATKPIFPTIQQGSRNLSLLSLGGTLMSAGMSTEKMRDVISWVNQNRCDVPLDATELKTILKSLEKYRR